MTIKNTIKKVLTEKGAPMTAKEIYREIDDRKLYQFNTNSPSSVVRNILRRHTEGIQMTAAPQKKCFKVDDGGKYYLID